MIISQRPFRHAKSRALKANIFQLLVYLHGAKACFELIGSQIAKPTTSELLKAGFRSTSSVTTRLILCWPTPFLQSSPHSASYKVSWDPLRMTEESQVASLTDIISDERRLNERVRALVGLSAIIKRKKPLLIFDRRARISYWLRKRRLENLSRRRNYQFAPSSSKGTALLAPLGSPALVRQNRSQMYKRVKIKRLVMISSS